jgi:hypothetical protein
MGYIRSGPAVTEIGHPPAELRKVNQEATDKDIDHEYRNIPTDSVLL